MILARPDIPGALYVVENMRDWDRREVFAGRWTDDPYPVAAELAACDFAWLAGTDRPIAAVGAFPKWPGVWSVLMIATDEFRSIHLSLTKFVKRVIIPTLVESGAHRAECHSLEGHEEAHRWLELLGARREGTCYGYGRNGENFHCYVWSREDVHCL